MQQAGGGKISLAAAARKEIDTLVARGMAPAGAADCRPKGYRIAGRGVGGIVDLNSRPSRAGDVRKMDNVVQGFATVVKKVRLRHR